VRSRRRHLYALAELVDRSGSDVEACRDEYLASLDADDGLLVLTIAADEIRASAARRAHPPARCPRCGARLPVKRHRCSRCGLAAR
jgi:hypothetical protein